MTDITLAGRQFRRCTNSSLQHDIFTMNHVRAADVLELELPAGASGEDYAAEMLGRLARYEHFYELLGCLLVPADTAWTPAVCKSTAAFLAYLTDPTDKAALNSVIAELLLGFFQAGHVSLRISPSFSGE